jgi:hypothetical protein
MDIQTCIARSFRAYRGKGATKTPAWGTEKSNLALDIANQKQEEWATDSFNNWNSLFRSDITSLDQIGTVSTSGTTLTGVGTYFTDFKAGDKITVSGETVRTIDVIASNTSLTVTVAFTNTASTLAFKQRPVISTVKEYKLHRSFMTPSDTITVEDTAIVGDEIELNIAKPEKRIDGDVYISGNPKVLTFYDEPTSQMIGKELLVPGYYHPSEMILATDDVKVDFPSWLVYSIAAELARNDAAKQGQFANLMGMANDIFTKMITANLDLGGTPTVPTNMPQITEDWSS